MSTLSRGDEGDAVRRLHARLRALCVPLGEEEAEGRFGVWTEAAIYVLQHGEGLAPDGVVGPQTAARLFRDEGAARPGCFAGDPAQTLWMVPGVPYFSQRDNAHRPLATCNVTSLAMALRYHGVSPRRAGQQLEDELFELATSRACLAHYQAQSPDLFRQGIPPYEVYDNLVWVVEQLGLAASFSTDRALSDLDDELRAGRPVLISGAFTGSGHIVLLIGRTAAGDFVCHDPYGDWNGRYHERDGEARIYERDRTLAVLKAQGAERKWGLFVSPPAPR